LTDLREHYNQTNIEETTAQMARYCGVVLGRLQLPHNQITVFSNKIQIKLKQYSPWSNILAIEKMNLFTFMRQVKFTM